MVEPQSSKLMVGSAGSHASTGIDRQLKTEIPAKTRPIFCGATEPSREMRGCSLVVKPLSSKQMMRVRFSSAPPIQRCHPSRSDTSREAKYSRVKGLNHSVQ